MLDRLSPDEARRTRRGAARAGTPHLRDDVARRGPGRPDARDAQCDPHEPLRHRPLRGTRARDRARHRLEAVRFAERREVPRTTRADAAPDGARAELRHRVRIRRAVRDRAHRPDPAHRRPGGRRVDSGRRQGQSHRPHDVARQGRPHGWRDVARGHDGHGRRRARRPCRRRALAARRRGRRDPMRGARQLRRTVGTRLRAPGRRQRAAVCGRALLPRHRPDRRRHAGPAGDPRSRRVHLLQGGSGRPGDGRVRAGGEAVARRPDSAGFRVPAAARGLGPVRGADGQRDPPHAVSRARPGEDAAQRPGELHARRQLHPRRSGRGRGLLRVRGIQFGRHRQLRRRRQARRRVDRRRRSARGPLGCRRAPLRPLPRQPPPPRRSHGRDARTALRDALAARGAPVRTPAAPFAAVRPAQGEGRGVRHPARLGACELLPAARRFRTAADARPARLAAATSRTSSARAASTSPSSTRRRSASWC